MSETNRLLSDSTPEKRIPSAKVGDRPVKTSSAWNVEETELKTSAVERKETRVEESTFISDVSPAHSKGSDKELLDAPKPADGAENGRDSPKSQKYIQDPSPMREVAPRSTDARSQRERIKQRIAAAKERVQATSQVKPKPVKKGKPPPEDDALSKEDEEVEEAMKRHKIMRSKWKVASAGIHVAGIQSTHEFFSRSSEDRAPTPPQNVGSVSPAQAPASPRSVVSEEEKLLVTDVLGSKEDDWLPLFSYESPKPENWDELKRRHVGLFFCPSASPVPIEEKLEPDTAPRFIEEEGLYVGKKASIPMKRRNKLEQRIMAMGSERLWFGEDGEIKGIQDPLDFRRFREYIDDVLDYDLIQYKPPTASECGKDERITNLGGQYTLELDVGAVSFRHHPLFSREEVLGSKLSGLVNTLSARSALVRRLGGRLTALRNFPSHIDSKKYKMELKDARNSWLKEAKYERELLESVLETWRDIKALRGQQGYTVTSYKLVIIARDDPEHGRGWQREFDFYLQELEDEAEADYRQKMEEYQKRFDEWNEQKQRTGELDAATTTTDDEGPDKPKRVPNAKLKQKVEEDLGHSLRPPGEPLIEVELKTDGSISTAVENIPQEHDRRLTAGKTQLWVALRHNDKEVDRVKTLQEPHFVYRASYRFCLRLNKWPKSLALRLIEVGQPNLFGRKPVAEIFVPVPGSCMNGKLPAH